MRTLILLGALLCSFIALHAQTNTFPSSGNVGIGTTSPINKLHVNGEMRWGGANDNYGYSGQDGGGLYIEQSGETVGKSRIRLQSSKSKDYANYSMFFIDPYNGFSFTGQGNANLKVGIGTTVPETLFHVRGNLSHNWLTTSDNSGLNGHKLYFGYANGTDTNYGLFISGGRNHSSQLDFAVENKFYVMGNGFVGIGTSTPAERLSVNGNVRAREIKVETANWPDYVFESSYKLPDLKETEQFIKANKHLPGVPSAKEVEKEGINLGEMNAKLLQKIEELTLYIIDLKKNSERQEQAIQNLQSKIK